MTFVPHCKGIAPKWERFSKPLSPWDHLRKLKLRNLQLLPQPFGRRMLWFASVLKHLISQPWRPARVAQRSYFWSSRCRWFKEMRESRRTVGRFRWLAKAWWNWKVWSSGVQEVNSTCLIDLSLNTLIIYNYIIYRLVFACWLFSANTDASTSNLFGCGGAFIFGHLFFPMWTDCR